MLFPDPMNWFTRLCRETGLMVHLLAKPVGPASRRVVNRRVEEASLGPGVTLRRTTIDEVEYERGARPDGGITKASTRG